MISARIHAELPAETWIKAVSQQMPNATFRLLSGVQAGDTAIELGEAVGNDLEAITVAIETQESISNFELLELAEDKALAKYETRDTGLYDLVSTSSLPIEYPVIVEDGWYELDIIGTRDEFRQLRAVLDSKGYSYELLSLVQERNPTEIITERQMEVLTIALRNGYFQVPRDCTIQDLSNELNLDKSTTSRILRRGVGRILQTTLTSQLL